MQNIYLFQPQYSEFINNKWRHWLPYSCGCLWSYAVQFEDIRENWRMMEMGFRREPIKDILDRLQEPRVCGFSCYLWNEKYNLELAQEIRRRWPNCLIFFGGPQTSSDYLQYDFIDCLMLGEGEISFTELLRSVTAGREIPEFWPKTRITDLAEMPPVYSSGVFDHIIEKHPDAMFNAVLETNRGCPFSCTFCDWGSLTYSKVKKFDLSKIESELAWMARSQTASIFLADANFGIFPERDLEIARMIKSYADASGTVDYVNLAYTKNSNEKVYQIARALMPYTKSVTLSMQSMNGETLEAIKRTNMKFNDLQEHIKLSQKYDVPTYTEMILGMPGETIESWKTGITNLLEAGQHNQIDVFFTLMLRNSEMSQTEYRRKYGIKHITVDNYMVFSAKRDDEDDRLHEKADLICATNQMSTEDMIESYMYSWVIGNFDTTGYSQITAKYCRNVLGISYRKFYDALYHKISTEDTCISAEYQEMRSAVHSLLTTGRIENLDVGVNHISFYHYVPMYFKKIQLMNLAMSVAEDFGLLPESFRDLQHHFVYDVEQSSEYFIQLSHDLDTWQPNQTLYRITGRAKNFEPTYFHLILQRKRGTMKNLIEKYSVSEQNKYVDNTAEMH